MASHSRMLYALPAAMNIKSYLTACGDWIWFLLWLALLLSYALVLAAKLVYQRARQRLSEVTDGAGTLFLAGVCLLALCAIVVKVAWLLGSLWGGVLRH